MCKLLDEASCHISGAIKADGAGNVESAVKHYLVGVEKLDVAIKDITDEKMLSFYTKDRAAVARRIVIIQSIDCASKPGMIRPEKALIDY